MSSSLLPFQRQALSELLQNDGLCVCGKGMGNAIIIAELVEQLAGRTSVLPLPALKGILSERHSNGVQNADGVSSSVEQHEAPSAAGTTAPLATCNGVVFVLNCPDWMEQQIRSWLKKRAALAPWQLPVSITNTAGAGERAVIYEHGGVVFITSRILVVDLLTGRVPPSAAGLLICRAERIALNGLEDFIVRKWWGGWRRGFVKAFSDDPVALTRGFDRAKKLLQTLHVRGLYLWPRFHVVVTRDLRAHEPDLVEMTPQLSPQMRTIHGALKDLAEAAWQELARLPRVDLQPLTSAAVILSTFTPRIRSKFSPYSSAVGEKASSLVEDLCLVCDLFSILLNSNSVDFWKILWKKRQSMSGERSYGPYSALWQVHPAADRLFAAARARVYGANALEVGSAEGSQCSSAPGPIGDDETRMQAPVSVQTTKTDAVAAKSSGATTPRPSPEAQPKWRSLESALDEITVLVPQLNTHGQRASTSGQGPATPAADEGGESDGIRRQHVLISVRDDRTALQLRQVLTQGATAVLDASMTAFEAQKRETAAASSVTGAPRPSAAGAISLAPTQMTLDAALQFALHAPDAAHAHQKTGSLGRGAHKALPRVQAKNAGKARPKPRVTRAAVPPSKRHRAYGWMKGFQRPSRPDGDHAPSGPSADGKKPAVDDTVAEASALPSAKSQSSDRQPSGVTQQVVITLDDDSDDDHDEATASGGLSPAPLVVTTADDDAKNCNRVKEDKAKSSAQASGEPNDAISPPNSSQTAPSRTPEWFSHPHKDRVDITITRFAGAQLDAMEPPFVVVYDPDVVMVRQLEVYKASRPGVFVRVYFMTYPDSAEETRFVNALEEEKTAFEALILGKTRMVLPRDLAPSTSAFVDIPQAHAPAPGAAAPQGARGQQLAKPSLDANRVGEQSSVEPELGKGPSSSVGAANLLPMKAPAPAPALPSRPRIIVDMREFRCALPNMIDLCGMEVVPMTLEIGDYILSPQICVERKSLSDLTQSLQHGRLHHQAEAMCRCYALPALLIELNAATPDVDDESGDDEEIGLDASAQGSSSAASSFSHQVSPWSRSTQDLAGWGFGKAGSSGRGGASSRQSDQPSPLMSKLSMLILSFPRLRILWSSSSRQSASLFARLKRVYGHEEPDPLRAAALGASSVDSTEQYRPVAMAVLRRFPGVTESNVRPLMRFRPALRALLDCSVDELTPIMGRDEMGKARAEAFLAFARNATT